MYRKNRFKICLLIIGFLLTASCNKDMFDAEDYKKIVEIAQPVNNIDESHAWDLTSSYYITVEAGTSSTEIRRLQILSANPAAGERAVILGDFPMSAKEKKYVSFVAPSLLTNFYAARIDANGTYTLVEFSKDQRTIGFSHPLATQAVVDNRLIGNQSFSYCFEDEMPQPGDYDYNDVVLRISIERAAKNQIMLNITLAAVGSLSQVAAGIRMENYKYDDIISVTTIDGETFDDGYKKSSLPFIDGNELLVRGIDNAAVINLFEDAHWATGVAHYASEGYIPRYKYNVSKTTSSEHDMMSPRTISYVVTFKESAQLDYFTLNLLDPFIIVEYMGAFMEVHAAYRYRSVTALHDYVQPVNATILPWAIVVPDGSFRYPLDGVNIGFAKEGALFGAYMTDKHAFGNWASNSGTALDWYLYPTGNMVY